MALKERLIAEYDVEVGITGRLLEQVGALPQDWAPHVRSRTLGQLVAHLAEVPAWGSYILDRLEFDLATLPETAPTINGAAAMALFHDHATTTRRLLDKTDGELAAVWKLTDDGDVVYSMPRTTAFRRLVLSHLIHHRGQLSVYARMAGAAEATIYGASGDDAWDDTPSP